MSVVFNLDCYNNLREQLDTDDKVGNVLGTKSAKLAFLASSGVKVPNGFILGKMAYQNFIDYGKPELPDDLYVEILTNIKKLETKTKCRYGIATNPLLLSIRADSKPSMPHMLDTILNVGLNDLTAFALEKITNNRGYVWNAYCRLIQSYSSVVLGIPSNLFDDLYEKFTKSRGICYVSDFDEIDWVDLARLYKSIVSKETGRQFPQDPVEQLKQSIISIYLRHTSDKVQNFAQYYKIPQKHTCTLIISEMVAGNNGNQSLSGVLSVRDPVTGNAGANGIYATNATNEDINKNRCKTWDIAEMMRGFPEIHKQLGSVIDMVSKQYTDPQTIEFVVQNNELFITQINSMVFTTAGLMKAISDLPDLGVPKEEAIHRCTAEDIIDMNLPQIDARDKPFAYGVPAGNGSAVGKIYTKDEDIISAAERGEPAILVRRFVRASDFQTILAAQGVITAEGTNWSSGTVLLRMLRKPAAIGCLGLKIDEENGEVTTPDGKVKFGDVVSIDSFGQAYARAYEKDDGAIADPNALVIMHWADEIRQGKFSVYTSVNDPKRIEDAVRSNAQGVVYVSLDSLVREQFEAVAADFLSEPTAEKLEPVFAAIKEKLAPIYKATEGGRIAVRLLDEPLSTFLPELATVVRELAVLKTRKEHDPEFADEENQIEAKEKLAALIRHHTESNPLMGICGIRMNLVTPHLLLMQVKAIVEASKEADRRPSVLLPGVTHGGEVKFIRERISQMLKEAEIEADIEFGAEVDTPRACFACAEIAKTVDYITVDVLKLTETTFGMCENDFKNRSLKTYADKEVLPSPFSKLDFEGIGDLLKEAFKNAREGNEKIEIGAVGPLVDNDAGLIFCCENKATMAAVDPKLITIARFCGAQAVSK